MLREDNFEVNIEMGKFNQGSYTMKIVKDIERTLEKIREDYSPVTATNSSSNFTNDLLSK